jgi:hypothetical protein
MTDIINLNPPDTLFQATVKINQKISEIDERLGNLEDDSELNELLVFMASKGQTNGLASLDSAGKVPTSQLGAIAITDTFPVASEAAMLALTCEKGDVAVRSDENRSYILKGTDPALIADWELLRTPTDLVLSVDGRTGVVTLSDIYEALSRKGAANGYPGLNASAKVVEDPANATATPAASKIPIADVQGNLDGWVSDATAAVKGKIQLAGQLGGTAASPTVVGIKESGGQALALAAITDGQILKRSGNTVVGTDVYEDIVVSIDGGGSAIAANATIWRVVDFACTIVGWTLLADASGSIVVNIWKDSYANYPPDVNDKITASAPPTISSATKAQSSTLTGWTTAIDAGDVLKFNVDSCSTVKTVVLCLKVKR